MDPVTIKWLQDTLLSSGKDLSEEDLNLLLNLGNRDEELLVAIQFVRDYLSRSAIPFLRALVEHEDTSERVRLCAAAAFSELIGDE